MYFSLSFEFVIREKRIRRRRNLSIYPAKHFCVESVCDKKGKRSKATSSRSKNKKKCTKYISAVCSAVLSTYTSTQYSILWRSKKKKKWEWFPVEIVLVVSNRSKRVYLSPFLISSSPIQSTLLFISKHIFEDGRIEGVAGEFVKKERKKIPSTNGNSRYIFRKWGENKKSILPRPLFLYICRLLSIYFWFWEGKGKKKELDAAVGRDSLPPSAWRNSCHLEESAVSPPKDSLNTLS